MLFPKNRHGVTARQIKRNEAMILPHFQHYGVPARRMRKTNAKRHSTFDNIPCENNWQLTTISCFSTNRLFMILNFLVLHLLSNVATAKIYPFLRKKSISTQNFPYVVCRFVVFNCLAYLFYIKVFIIISFLKVSFTRKTKTTYDKRHLTLTSYLRAHYI